MAGRALGKLPSQLLVQIALFDAQTRDADLDAVEVGACAWGLVALVFMRRGGVRGWMVMYLGTRGRGARSLRWLDSVLGLG